MEEMTIFDILYPKYKIKKPIRLIELFSGYGSQALALKYLGTQFEHYKTCEWAVKSIQAYKDIHFSSDKNDYSASFDIDFIKKFLLEKGISQNYNEQLEEKQINKMGEQYARNIFNNIISTHNLVNIQKAKGSDLDINNTEKYDYILTYSFPCQDLSLAGKGKGMRDTSTRSGMLWEVERLLTECKELGEMPQILLMENVPQVHSQDNVKDFQKWQLKLEELGYKNYMQDLIATDYGIPQTRNRCFMVSILGNYSYTFPKTIPLKLKLKDMLEENVDDKYYLSDKMINFFQDNEQKQKEKGNGFKFNVSDGNTIAKTITTRAGSRMDDNYVKANNKKSNMKKEMCNKVLQLGQKKAYDTIRHSYTSSRLNGNFNECRQNNISPTLDTRCDCIGVVVEPKIIDDRDINWNGTNITDYCPTQRASNNRLKVLQTDLRIRKLTPKECFRLMGVKDEDFKKVAKNQSDISLYHLAGDSIVVNVLMAIFKELI